LIGQTISRRRITSEKMTNPDVATPERSQSGIRVAAKMPGSHPHRSLFTDEWRKQVAPRKLADDSGRITGNSETTGSLPDCRS
jgi:hypothetical protein